MTPRNRFYISTFLICLNIIAGIRSLKAQNHEGLRLNDSNWLPWVSLDKAKVENLIYRSMPSVSNARPLPDSDPIVVKTQAILDRFHEALTARYPKAPAPRAIIFPSESQRIFTMGKPFCFPVYITWKKDKAPKAAVLRSSAIGVSLLENLPSSDDCEYLGSLPKELKIDILSAALPFDTECMAITTGNFIRLQLDIKPQCAASYIPTHLESKLQTYGSAGYMSSNQAVNWIVLTDKAIKESAEELFIARLAHELVHYYEAHSFYGRGFDYFYELKDDDWLSRKQLDPTDSAYDIATKVKQINASTLLHTDDRRLLKQAYDSNLGYYTAEQQADEIALTYLDAINLEPRLMIEALFDSLKRSPSRDIYPMLPAQLAPSFLTCFNLFQGDFVTKVGVGVYHNPHHTLCFRIYNLFKILND